MSKTETVTTRSQQVPTRVQVARDAETAPTLVLLRQRQSETGQELAHGRGWMHAAQGSQTKVKPMAAYYDNMRTFFDTKAETLEPKTL